MSIKHNGFTFPLRTYNNKALRNLHLWRIESDLRQAIGRARPYSTLGSVMVLSAYPLPEAVVKIKGQTLLGTIEREKNHHSKTFGAGNIGEEKPHEIPPYSHHQAHQPKNLRSDDSCSEDNLSHCDGLIALSNLEQQAA
jgi:hypothetical protein